MLNFLFEYVYMYIHILTSISAGLIYIYIYIYIYTKNRLRISLDNIIASRVMVYGLCTYCFEIIIQYIQLNNEAT